jgi:hypothetical protein
LAAGRARRRILWGLLLRRLGCGGVRGEPGRPWLRFDAPGRRGRLGQSQQASLDTLLIDQVMSGGVGLLQSAVGGGAVGRAESVLHSQGGDLAVEFEQGVFAEAVTERVAGRR